MTLRGGLHVQSGMAEGLVFKQINPKYGWFPFGFPLKPLQKESKRRRAHPESYVQPSFCVARAILSEEFDDCLRVTTGHKGLAGCTNTEQMVMGQNQNRTPSENGWYTYPKMGYHWF